MQQNDTSSPAPRPVPQPYGVSHEGAETLVRDWMRHLGALDAEITRYSQDGGVDVFSDGVVVQVKNYKGSVSVLEVRELYGVAQAEGKSGLLFTSGTVTADGLAFADRVRLPLLRYCAEDATLVGLNALGDEIVVRGLPGTGVRSERQATQQAAEQADELASRVIEKRGYRFSTVQEWLDTIDGLLTKYEKRWRRNLAADLDEDFYAIDRLLATRTTDAETTLRLRRLKQKQRSLLGRDASGEMTESGAPHLVQPPTPVVRPNLGSLVAPCADVGDERLERYRADRTARARQAADLEAARVARENERALLEAARENERAHLEAAREDEEAHLEAARVKALTPRKRRLTEEGQREAARVQENADRIARRDRNVRAEEEASKQGYEIWTVEEWLDALDKQLTDCEQLTRRERNKEVAAIHTALRTITGILVGWPGDDGIARRAADLRERAR